jgi:hypothetical protein
MLGFEGPFRFDIEDVGAKISWESLDQTLQDELTSDGRYTRTNSDVYICRIAVAPSEYVSEKNQDWSKVKRVFIEARADAPISIGGISPTTKKVNQLNQQELALLKTISGAVKLFNALEFKLDVSNPVGLLARKDRFAVMSFFTRNVAQWVFSDGWEQIGFELFLYVVVPANLPEEGRHIKLSIKPTWKKNKFLSQVSIWRREVRLV